jgi:hypothetical protein
MRAIPVLTVSTNRVARVPRTPNAIRTRATVSATNITSDLRARGTAMELKLAVLTVNATLMVIASARVIGTAISAMCIVWTRCADTVLVITMVNACATSITLVPIAQSFAMQ